MDVIQVEDDDKKLSAPDVFNGDAINVTFDTNGNEMINAGNDIALLFHDDYPMDLTFVSSPSLLFENDEVLVSK